MHFADGIIPEDYLGYVRRKYLWILGGIVLLFFLLIISISVGAAGVPPYDVLLSIVNGTIDRVSAFLHSTVIPAEELSSTDRSSGTSASRRRLPRSSPGSGSRWLG